MAHNGNLSIIGKPQLKVDALQKVTGETRFADDLSLPRMLYGKLLRSVYPHARILGVDTTRAEQLPGVFAVITGKDLPIKYGIMPSTQDEEHCAWIRSALSAIRWLQWPLLMNQRPNVPLS